MSELSVMDKLPSSEQETSNHAVVSSEEVTPSQESASNASEASEAPKPRKRGRRSKAEIEAARKAEEELKQTAEPESGSVAPDTAAAFEEAPKPRKRGRRSKAEIEAARRAEEEKTLAQTSPSEDAQPVREQPVEAPAVDTHPLKRRVRRTKQDAESAAVTDQNAPASETASEGDAEKSDAPKRRQRRVHQVEQASLTPEVQPVEAQDAPEQASDEREQQRSSRMRTNRRGERSDRVQARDTQSETRNERNARNDRDRQERHARNDRDNRDMRNDRQNQNNHSKQNNNNRRQQRFQREQTPKVSLEELQKLKVADLREKAAEFEIDPKGLLKAELIQAIYDAAVKKEGLSEAEGVLDILTDGYGFLRCEGYLPSEHDVYVSASMIRRQGLRKGDMIAGQIRKARPNEKYGALQQVRTINGIAPEVATRRPFFKDLTPVYPDERLVMEHGKQSITSRVIDLAAPIGKGQRGLIVSPPKAGKTTVLKQIAASIAENNPECHLMCLLVDERPEEVTDMQRSVHGEVISSTFDMPAENHIAVAEMVIERAKRLVEMGRDVVILLDSITRLARAYNLAQPASGRILSGGVDSTALYPPKRFLGAARNIEFGGSLTILASALIDTGSKMDEVIFEEFKGTGNMELKLDRSLADRRIYPAIDPVQSGTRKEDLLLNSQEAPLIWAVRRILANMNNTERAMDMLIKSLKQTETNQEFLLRTAKKAQGRRLEDNMEL